MPRKKQVTLKTIADELGLTIQTVSKAIHRQPGMSEQTRKGIWETALRLRYVTKEQVEALATERVERFPAIRKRFVLVLSKAALNYNRLLMQGLLERFAEFGHEVDLGIIPEQAQGVDFKVWLEEIGVIYSDGVFIGPRIG